MTKIHFADENQVFWWGPSSGCNWFACSIWDYFDPQWLSQGEFTGCPVQLGLNEVVRSTNTNDLIYSRITGQCILRWHFWSLWHLHSCSWNGVFLTILHAPCHCIQYSSQFLFISTCRNIRNFPLSTSLNLITIGYLLHCILFFSMNLLCYFMYIAADYYSLSSSPKYASLLSVSFILALLFHSAVALFLRWHLLSITQFINTFTITFFYCPSSMWMVICIVSRHLNSIVLIKTPADW